ncbi:MAG: class I SAM-dependent methyltransferase [Vulcanimicrobiaceae bacterium]
MKEHWDSVFGQNPERFGLPSVSAQIAMSAIQSMGIGAAAVLDLGSGSGRDTLFFAGHGMNVVALDFSQIALDAIAQKARSPEVSRRLHTVMHDVREPLPFGDATFDVCYSHMLYCMDFTLADLLRLSAEVKRVLKPGGLQVYTARTTEDPDFGVGVHRGEKIYEDEGFPVHFFDREMIDQLAVGFKILAIEEFEEGSLPRRLFAVVQQNRTAG